MEEAIKALRSLACRDDISLLKIEFTSRKVLAKETFESCLKGVSTSTIPNITVLSKFAMQALVKFAIDYVSN